MTTSAPATASAESVTARGRRQWCAVALPGSSRRSGRMAAALQVVGYAHAHLPAGSDHGDGQVCCSVMRSGSLGSRKVVEVPFVFGLDGGGGIALPGQPVLDDLVQAALVGLDGLEKVSVVEQAVAQRGAGEREADPAVCGG